MTRRTTATSSSSCNPEAEEIIGGYRYLFGRNWRLNADGQPELATSHMFHFSDRFLQEYMPYTVELGRSFVSLDYQNVRKNSKSIFALDNLWDGLGALTVINPDVRYFFGKMTMYPSYIRIGRDMILYFLKKHFDDKDHLIVPIHPLSYEHPEEQLAKIFTAADFREDYRILNREIRHLELQYPAARQRLHEPLADDETLRNGHQRRFWRGGGDGHPHCRR